MTTQRTFKRLVRSRMEKTGESYTAARAAAAAGDEPQRISLATSDETIRERTGRGWEEWFDLLDEWGAADKTHRETAPGSPASRASTRWPGTPRRSPAATSGPAAAAQVGEHEDGVTVTASKTVAVPVERLYDAFVDASLRERWLPGGALASGPRRSRARPASTGARTAAASSGLAAKGEAKRPRAKSYVRLADGEEAERMKAYWRDRVAGLKEVLEASAPSPASGP